MTNTKSTLLIVDDEPNNLHLMQQILSEDYQLAFASNGKKALELSQKMLPDMILLDVMMPEIDGYEVCRSLKADELTKNIPIIFVTAKDAIEDETKGLELGAIDYITKPINPSIVRARVKNHLEMKLARECIENQKKLLEEQNRKLIEASRLREDVDRIIRHDMKNPLNSIIGLSHILKEDKNLGKDQIEMVALIEQAGYDLLNMINLSLDMFKMERGIYQFEPERLNILSVIDKIFKEIKPIMNIKQLNTTILLNGAPVNADSCVFVQGEKLLSYSMLLNLIKNAVEASPKKGMITVHIETKDKNAFIHIHNSGTVPIEIRESFFEKYVTSGKKRGTGLGTYSAKLIAETQKGQVWMNTSEEKGTTVTVMLRQYEF